MARQLTFRIGKKEFSAEPAKVDRRKLYGWTEVEATDEQGLPCHLVSTDDSGTLIIPPGGTGLGILDGEGLWVDRSELVYVNRDGTAAELLPSSYSTEIKLSEKVTPENFLDYSITDFYLLNGLEGDFLKAIGDEIYTFLYCYVDGCEGFPAFVMAAETEGEGRVAFLLVGVRNRFEMLGFEEPGVIEETDEDMGDGDDDNLDFSMF